MQCGKFLVEDKCMIVKIKEEPNEEITRVLMKQRKLIQKRNRLHKLKVRL